jgi:hypothetical protein
VARHISMTTRKELVQALRLRYRSVAFGDRIKFLDESMRAGGELNRPGGLISSGSGSCMADSALNR